MAPSLRLSLHSLRHQQKELLSLEFWQLGQHPPPSAFAHGFIRTAKQHIVRSSGVTLDHPYPPWGPGLGITGPLLHILPLYEVRTVAQSIYQGQRGMVSLDRIREHWLLLFFKEHRNLKTCDMLFRISQAGCDAKVVLNSLGQKACCPANVTV